MRVVLDNILNDYDLKKDIYIQYTNDNDYYIFDEDEINLMKENKTHLYTYNNFHHFHIYNISSKDNEVKYNGETVEDANIYIIKFCRGLYHEPISRLLIQNIIVPISIILSAVLSVLIIYLAVNQFYIFSILIVVAFILTAIIYMCLCSLTMFFNARYRDDLNDV